jgi:heme oxygenase
MLLHLIKVLSAYKPNEFSKKIKKQTKVKHDQIESHPFIKEMLSGELSDFKYAVYLNNLLPIYKSVEMFLFNKRNTNSDIVQSKKILNDINSYTNFLNVDLDQSHLLFYHDWLNHFTSKNDFFKKTELYIRWLADMYGGQIIKKNIRFGSKYDFVDIRGDIKFVRQLIENNLNSQNVDSFIDEVNKSYDFHYKLVEKVYDATIEPVY